MIDLLLDSLTVQAGRGVHCGVRYLTPGRGGGHIDGPGVVGTC